MRWQTTVAKLRSFCRPRHVDGCAAKSASPCQQDTHRETTAGMRATTLCWLAQVKLDPSRVDAWNCLGNCFWKKKDLKAAMNCFTGAAKQVRLPRRRDGDSLPCACWPPAHRPISTRPLQSPNATSLRQLSMLMRQMGDTPQERAANIKVGRA